MGEIADEDFQRYIEELRPKPKKYKHPWQQGKNSILATDLIEHCKQCTDCVHCEYRVACNKFERATGRIPKRFKGKVPYTWIRFGGRGRPAKKK